MNKPGQPNSREPQIEKTADFAQNADDLIAQQNQAFAKGAPIAIEKLLERFNPSADCDSAIMDLICNEVAHRKQSGERPSLAEYLQRFPALAEALEIQWEIDRLVVDTRDGDCIQFVHDANPNVTKQLQRDHEPGLPQFQRTIAIKPNHRTDADDFQKHAFISHYRVEAQIGRGGMGVVYRAIDFKLDRLVALKCIRNLDLATNDVKSRFEREALSAARLSHRNIVTVYEYGCDEDVPYIAMEYIEGQSLAELLRLQGNLNPHDAVALLRQIASAVGYAHDNGIIHRDLKPGNILVDGEGVPRVADFGLARAEVDFPKLTISGDILGTPSYMSPEQAAGRLDSVGRPSDVYSLGAILYECLTGTPPFRAENTQLTLMQVIEGSVIPVRKHRPEVSRDVETVCMKCLAKLPEHRYANAHELVADLDRLLNEQPVRVRSWTAQERLHRFARENVVFISIVAASIATLPVFLLMPTRSFRAENREADGRSHATAIRYLTSLIESDPSRAVTFMRRAEHRLALGDFASAKEDATRAQSLGYSHPQHVHLILGKCELYGQDYPAAATDFHSVVSLDADCCEAWVGLGQSQLKNGELSSAIESLTKAINLQPDNAGAYELRAMAFIEQGSFEKAKSDRIIASELMEYSDSTK